ncbi:MAG: sigma-70 family RNA polymerase sigma factor [Gaiellaceae bacterium]
MRRRQDDRAADRTRFEYVYRHTRVAVLGYFLRRMTDPEDAADLLADVYLIAWRRIGDVPRGAEARLWLFGVARRVLANHHRKKRSETGLANELQTNLRLLEFRSDDPENESSAEAVRAALATLDERDRELLTLSAWEELSPAQIATVVGRPAGLVRVQLHRARRKLGEQIAYAKNRNAAHSELVQSAS